MTIRETDTTTLQEWLATLTESRDHRSHNQRVAATIRIKIKAIEYTLREREGATI